MIRKRKKRDLVGVGDPMSTTGAGSAEALMVGVGVGVGVGMGVGVGCRCAGGGSVISLTIRVWGLGFEVSMYGVPI